MARTLAQVQTTLQLLYAQYDALAGKTFSTMSGPERSITYNEMARVRKEIEELEAIETKLEAEDAGTTPGVAYARFEVPS